MTLPAKNKFDPAQPIDIQGNAPSQSFRDYMTKLDALITAMSQGNAPTLINAANDAAAAKAGVAIGSFYRNGTVVHVRQV